MMWKTKKGWETVRLNETKDTWYCLKKKNKLQHDTGEKIAMKYLLKIQSKDWLLVPKLTLLPSSDKIRNLHQKVKQLHYKHIT